MWEHKTEVLL